MDYFHQSHCKIPACRESNAGTGLSYREKTRPPAAQATETVRHFSCSGGAGSIPSQLNGVG
jgi:hypothetical protein